MGEIVENCFEGDNIIEFRDSVENKISVFCVNHEKYRDDEQYSVLVRFTKFSDYINKHSHHFVYDRCIGRPERIWFERNDKVSQIFDRLGDGSKAFYFFNESHVPSNLTKC